MIHYILQTVAFQILFLLVYDLFLKKETFFNLNRVYLVVTPLLSFILPLIKLDLIRNNISEDYLIELPSVLINSNAEQIILPEIFINSAITPTSDIALGTIIVTIWSVGILLTSLLFLNKIKVIFRLRKKGIKTKFENFELVVLPKTNAAFSFFNTVFLGESLSKEKQSHILLHEKVHVQEYHSSDLLFFEILRILFWFNPLVYIYQKRVALLQEYIADAKAVLETDKKTYYQGLLAQVFQTDKISFINTFYNHSLIKNRIVMLQKSKSKKIAQLRYLLLIPIVCSMLVYTSCSQDAHAQEAEDLTKTELLKKIEAVQKQLEIQGNISDREEEELKKLAMLVTGDFSNPKYKEVVEKVELPFGTIDKAPVFPGCEGLSVEEAKTCFVKNVSQHVVGQFNVETGKGLTGMQKIYVKFKIDNTGNIKNVYATAAKKELEQEAIRVVQSLPKMKPGEQDGTPVAVLYSLPIVFKLNE